MKHDDEESPADHRSRARGIAGAAFAAAFAYAVARYVVLGTVPVSQLPLFVTNKAIALASLLLIAACLSIGPLVRLRAIDARWMRDRKGLGVHGFALGALHAVLTIAMLSPSIYAKLYETDGRFTFAAGLAILSGALMVIALGVPAVTSLDGVRRAMTPRAWRAAQRLAVPALGVGVVHVVALGWKSWMTPATWPGGLPPLTMVAIAGVGLAVAIRAIGSAMTRRGRRVGARGPAAARVVA